MSSLRIVASATEPCVAVVGDRHAVDRGHVDLFAAGAGRTCLPAPASSHAHAARSRSGFRPDTDRNSSVASTRRRRLPALDVLALAAAQARPRGRAAPALQLARGLEQHLSGGRRERGR